MVKKIIETKPTKNIIVLDKFSTADDIIAELEDISTQHTEDSNKPLKKLTKSQRKNAIRAKIAERNADIRMKILNKFFGD